MEHKLSRRSFLATAAGAAAAERLFRIPGAAAQTRATAAPAAKSIVSLVQGEDRRRNVLEALTAIEDQIRPVLRTKKYAVIKPNLVSTVNQLAATHADALRGIIEFLGRRFKGPIIIAESSAGDTLEGYGNFEYPRVVDEFRSRRVSLVDLNDEQKYETIPLINGDLHAVPCRLAARLLDPDAFIICSAMLKTHNVTVASLSVKNMTLGAPLHSPRTEARTRRWNDKRIYHGGVRQTHFDILLTAQKMRPYWGVTVIDGYEGMEGNGPSSGTPVPSRLAIASTDFIAADRVGVEAMGINPDWFAYLRWCEMAGLGCYDLAGIDIRGARLADVRRQYQLHKDIERELQWMGRLTEIPPRLG